MSTPRIVRDNIGKYLHRRDADGVWFTTERADGSRWVQTVYEEGDWQLRGEYVQEAGTFRRGDEWFPIEDLADSVVNDDHEPPAPRGFAETWADLTPEQRRLVKVIAERRDGSSQPTADLLAALTRYAPLVVFTKWTDTEDPWQPVISSAFLAYADRRFQTEGDGEH